MAIPVKEVNKITATCLQSIVKTVQEHEGNIGDTLVILEGIITGVLISQFVDPDVSKQILNEGLVPGVEARIDASFVKLIEGSEDASES